MQEPNLLSVLVRVSSCDFVDPPMFEIGPSTKSHETTPKPHSKNQMKRTTILTFFAATLFLVLPLVSLIGNSSPQREKKKCPTVEINGPKKSRAFNPFVYRGQIKNLPKGFEPVLKWSLIGARILEGQGTDVIRVKPVGLHVTATLTLENALTGCESSKASLETEITHILYGLPPSIRSVQISPSAIVRPCSSGTKSEACPTTSNQVQVRGDADRPDDADVSITWEVTAGRVIGEGEKVIWDLSGVAKGTYTITACAQYSFAGWTSKDTPCGSATLTISDCTDCKPQANV